MVNTELWSWHLSSYTYMFTMISMGSLKGHNWWDKDVCKDYLSLSDKQSFLRDQFHKL
jgi:hypothetical protein